MKAQKSALFSKMRVSLVTAVKKKCDASEVPALCHATTQK